MLYKLFFYILLWTIVFTALPLPLYQLDAVLIILLWLYV